MDSSEKYMVMMYQTELLILQTRALTFMADIDFHQPKLPAGTRRSKTSWTAKKNLIGARAYLMKRL